MKRWLILLCVSIGLTAPGVEGPPPPKPPELLSQAAQQGAPKLVCDEPTFDFGERDSDTTVNHEFVLRNSGAAPLVISGVRSSCGCTVASMKQKTLQPGEQTLVEAKFNLKGRRGRQQKSIQIQSNDPTKPQMHLWMKGTAVAELSPEPLYVNFGNIEEESAKTQNIKLVGRKKDLVITGITCDQPSLDVSAWGTNDTRGVGFDVRTVPPLKTGYLRGNVTVVTNNEKKPEVKIPVFGNVRGDLMVIPREIILRKQMAGPVTRAIILRPGSQGDFKVTGVDCPLEGVTVNIARQGTGMYRIDLRDLKPVPEWDGKKVRIHTDCKSMKEVLVPVRVLP